METATSVSRREHKNRTGRAWLRLLRPPNLFTVPGDPLVGQFLASSGSNLRVVHLAPPLVASLLLYSSGLLGNDWFDLEVDRRERPERPLPSGEICPALVAVMACVSGIGGVLVAGLSGWQTAAFATTLLVLIGLYDGILKRVPVVGPFTMGLCRGTSLLMGASAVPDARAGAFPVAASAAALTAFIAIITFIAQHETGTRRPPAAFLWAAPTIVVGWLVVVTLSVPTTTWARVLAACLSAAAFGWMAHVSHCLARSTRPCEISANVGRYLRGLLLTQAALCSLWAGPAASLFPYGVAAACALVAAFPLASWTAKRFYAS